VDKALRIAGAAGMPLMIAAKVDKADRAYFENEIEPLIRQSPHVEFIGEINDSQKPAFLSGAHALLFPIDWPEPFGLVMIESMACGTPVIAFNRASVPEVIDDSLTGFIVTDEAAAIAAVDRLGELDRGQVRQQFERRFTARRMAEDYLDLYEELCMETAPLLRAVNG
jgi:glycosyltransferase involved in cell wall biosynthesis